MDLKSLQGYLFRVWLLGRLLDGLSDFSFELYTLLIRMVHFSLDVLPMEGFVLRLVLMLFWGLLLR
jgi:hypothetical protein